MPPQTTIPFPVYSVPNPNFDIAEVYIVYAEVHPDASGTGKCWVVKEKHAWFDDVTKEIKREEFTLNPDSTYCVDIDEAFRQIDKQLAVRAKHGFKYLFMWDPYEPPWFKRYEVDSNGNRTLLK